MFVARPSAKARASGPRPSPRRWSSPPFRRLTVRSDAVPRPDTPPTGTVATRQSARRDQLHVLRVLARMSSVSPGNRRMDASAVPLAGGSASPTSSCARPTVSGRVVVAMLVTTRWPSKRAPSKVPGGEANVSSRTGVPLIALRTVASDRAGVGYETANATLPADIMETGSL